MSRACGSVKGTRVPRASSSWFCIERGGLGFEMEVTLAVPITEVASDTPLLEDGRHREHGRGRDRCRCGQRCRRLHPQHILGRHLAASEAARVQVGLVWSVVCGLWSAMIWH